ncbi:hypothetical protein ABK040_003268 [Willaertia magna]
MFNNKKLITFLVILVCLILHSVHGSNLHEECPNALRSPNALQQGEKLCSSNGKYSANLQSDNNFVVYEVQNNRALWASNTKIDQQIESNLHMQSDGNLVLYASYGQVIWATHTNNKGEGPYRLEMQDDGNLVVYDVNRKPLWASNTRIEENQ